MSTSVNAELRGGDLAITDDALPIADTIVHAKFGDVGIQFRPDSLYEYLGFLESVVLHRRIVVPILQISTMYPEAYELYERISSRYNLCGLLAIQQIAFDTLLKCGVFAREALAMPPDIVRQTFQRYLDNSPYLRERFAGYVDALPLKYDVELRKEVAFLLAYDLVGHPLLVGEVACSASIPFTISPDEAESVQAIERDETKVARDVASYLIGQLNAHGRSEVARITPYTDRFVHPETPIAWRIIESSSTPEDFCRVTLQLRDEFASFRKHTQEIDDELRSQDAPLKRKLQLLREVEAVAGDLWPSEPGGFRKTVVEVASIIGAMPGIPSSATSGFAAIATLLDKPLEKTLQLLRRRRFRVLYKSKRRFLNAASSHRKLAELFRVAVSDVRAGFAEFPPRISS